jgi:hypothetical protein
MKPRQVYLCFAVIGLVVPYYFLGKFLLASGFDPRAFVRQLIATPVSTFFATDLVIASLVFIRFLRRESARYAIHDWWLYAVALLTVGLSFALPLFLYTRETRREKLRGAGSLHEEHP